MYQDYMGDGRTKHKSLRSSLVPTRILVLASQLFLSIICKKKLDLHTIFLSFFFLCADGVVDVCPKKEACSSTTRPGTPIKLCSSVGFLVELEHWFNNKHNRGSSFRLRETKSSYLQSLGVLCCVRRSYPGAPCSAQSTQIIVNLVCA